MQEIVWEAAALHVRLFVAVSNEKSLLRSTRRRPPPRRADALPLRTLVAAATGPPRSQKDLEAPWQRRCPTRSPSVAAAAAMADPAAAAAAVAAPPRSQLSDFTILKELGRGTCESSGCMLAALPLLFLQCCHMPPPAPHAAVGAVFLARRAQDGQLYALKQVQLSNRSAREQMEAVQEAKVSTAVGGQGCCRSRVPPMRPACKRPPHVNRHRSNVSPAAAGLTGQPPHHQVLRQLPARGLPLHLHGVCARRQVSSSMPWHQCCAKRCHQ